MKKVSAEIKDHIEQKVLPRYNGLKGHTGEHIEQVIRRSLKFSEQVPEVNPDMVYIIAAYHDLGRLVDNDTHNIESAKMLKGDEFLKAHFTDEEIKIMAEAVEDHRASLGREPRSIYGKIVSSADRNTSVETLLKRAYDYQKSLHPEMTEDELFEYMRVILRKKYSPDGYAAKTMYFNDPNFGKMLVETEKITREPEGFKKVLSDFNRKRFSENKTSSD